MKLLAEYFGLMVFGFVVFMAGLVALPPDTSVGELVGLGLAFVVISGGFTWYYSAALPSNGQGPRRREQGPPSRR